ncbi:MAG: trypsin-like peptidase domain-containing protein [archaeon]
MRKELAIALFVIIVAGSSIATYYIARADYGSRIYQLNTSLIGMGDRLSAQIEASNELLLEQIAMERTFSVRERALLRNQTQESLNRLEQLVDLEVTLLKINLESQLGDVSSDVEKVRKETESKLEGIDTQIGGLSEKSSELENKISEIDVTSSDFSAIIGDVIKAVVSVKTDKGQGSGVIFDSRGYILTNRHVIEDATSIYAVDYDSIVYKVDVIAVATNLDLAVIKMDTGRDMDFLEFETRAPRVGERIIAVGNPLGLSFSVTEGIVSAASRAIDGISYIQTDVPINFGNSGGPLVNANKRIVGINTFKIADTEGLGFAIPAAAAQQMAEQVVG